jgi:hypothetical protein
LPTHWEWLSNQTGGASATLRRLVDERAKAESPGKDRAKKSQEVTFKVLTAIAGDLPNFEEAIRYLYRKDGRRFRELIADWPKDVIAHAMALAEEAFR